MEKEAQQYADVIAAELQELEAALEAFIDEHAEAADFDGVTFTDPTDLVHHYVNYCALSVEDVSAISYATGEITSERRAVEVTRTVGGPGCFVTFHGDGRATVRAYWGTGRGRRNVEVPYADAELWELMDALAAVSK